MKLGVKPGLQALFLATLLATSFIMAAPVSAVDSGESIPPEPALLYRVRYGAPWRGEIADRFFIERNIALAETLGIVGDDDPDGDGWAIVGHTDTDYDGKKIGGFAISYKKLPMIMLYWNSDKQCALLTPSSLDVVKPDEDRLLKAQVQRLCFSPATDINVTILQPPDQPDTETTEPPIQVEPSQTPTVTLQPPQPEVTPTIEHINAPLFDTPDQPQPIGFVEGASTTKVSVINHTDTLSSDDAAETTSQSGNIPWADALIVAAGLFGTGLLIRFLLLMKS